MNYLFVCTFNNQRSPTAERVFKEILKSKRVYGNVKSAGIYETAPTRVTQELIKWADRIYVMEQYHKDFILKMNPKAKNKIKILGIEDRYFRDDPVLVRILKDKLEKEI